MMIIKKTVQEIGCGTVKGKGVPSMENRPEWHGLPPTPQQAEAFIAELLGGNCR